MRAAPLLRLFTTGPGCGLCERTKADLARLADHYDFRLEVVDLHDLDRPPPSYAVRAPVLTLEGHVLAEGRIEASVLERALRSAGIRTSGTVR